MFIYISMVRNYDGGEIERFQWRCE